MPHFETFLQPVSQVALVYSLGQDFMRSSKYQFGRTGALDQSKGDHIVEPQIRGDFSGQQFRKTTIFSHTHHDRRLVLINALA